MRLQIAFDGIDLPRILTIAKNIQEYADIFEIGSLLMHKYGDEVIKRFREQFPSKTICVDLKIIDHPQEAVMLCSQAGADWISIMAGSGKDGIHTACSTAHNMGKKILLDLSDASSMGQSALDAKALGVDALLFHIRYGEDPHISLADRWDIVRGNSDLPITIVGSINRALIPTITTLKPSTIIIGKAIVYAEDPIAEARYFQRCIQQ